MSYVLGLDGVVLGDGGVSSCDVGRYVYVGDVAVSCGGDMELCGVLTQRCQVLLVGVSVTLTGCQELVTRM